MKDVDNKQCEEVIYAKEDEYICPICAEQMDEGDISFFPCPCDYQICLWCLQRIRESDNARCPLCRSLYDESQFRVVPVRKIVRQDEIQKNRHSNQSDNFISIGANDTNANAVKTLDTTSANNVSPFIKKPVTSIPINTDCGSGKLPIVARLFNLPAQIMCAKTLADYRYLGKYGKIQALSIIPHKNEETIFVIYNDEESVKLLSIDLRKFINESKDPAHKLIRLSIGSARSCIYSLKGINCPNEKCVYIHHNLNRNGKNFWKSIRNLSLPINCNEFIQNSAKPSLFSLKLQEVSEMTQKAIKFMDQDEYSDEENTNAVVTWSSAITRKAWQKNSFEKKAEAQENRLFPSLEAAISDTREHKDIRNISNDKNPNTIGSKKSTWSSFVMTNISNSEQKNSEKNVKDESKLPNKQVDSINIIKNQEEIIDNENTGDIKLNPDKKLENETDSAQDRKVSLNILLDGYNVFNWRKNEKTDNIFNEKWIESILECSKRKQSIEQKMAIRRLISIFFRKIHQTNQNTAVLNNSRIQTNDLEKNYNDLQFYTTESK